MHGNVRRYVALVRQLADGGAPVLTEASGPYPVPNAEWSGACPVPKPVGPYPVPNAEWSGACPVPKPTRQCRESVGMFLHSWCGAGLCGYYFVLALAKTMTPGGGPLTVPSGAGRTANHLTVLFSQKVLAVRKSQ